MDRINEKTYSRLFAGSMICKWLVNVVAAVLADVTFSRASLLVAWSVICSLLSALTGFIIFKTSSTATSANTPAPPPVHAPSTSVFAVIRARQNNQLAQQLNPTQNQPLEIEEEIEEEEEELSEEERELREILEREEEDMKSGVVLLADVPDAISLALAGIGGSEDCTLGKSWVIVPVVLLFTLSLSLRVLPFIVADGGDVSHLINPQQQEDLGLQEDVQQGETPQSARTRVRRERRRRKKARIARREMVERCIYSQFFACLIGGATLASRVPIYVLVLMLAFPLWWLTPLEVRQFKIGFFGLPLSILVVFAVTGTEWLACSASIWGLVVYLTVSSIALCIFSQAIEKRMVSFT